MKRTSLFGAIALVAVVLAWALPLQSVGCGQSSHYAATRSFAQGHSYVDRYAEETCDIVRHGRHYYTAKGARTRSLGSALVPPPAHRARGAAESERR